MHGGSGEDVAALLLVSELCGTTFFYIQSTTRSTALVASSLIYCAALCPLSLAKPNQYYLACLPHAGCRPGLGLTFLPALDTATHHFARRRGLAIGLMTSGASIGGIVFPLVLNRLLFTHGFVVGAAHTRTLPADARPVYMVFVLAGLVLGLFYPVFYLRLYAITRGVRTQLAFDTVSVLNAGGGVGRLLPPLRSRGELRAEQGVMAIALVYGALNTAFVALTPTLLAELSTDRSKGGLPKSGLMCIIHAAYPAHLHVSGHGARARRPERQVWTQTRTDAKHTDGQYGAAPRWTDTDDAVPADLTAQLAGGKRRGRVPACSGCSELDAPLGADSHSPLCAQSTAVLPRAFAVVFHAAARVLGDRTHSDF
ncbi:hypothetical protein FB451DRAFT_1564038 [Mycena latifolia]|nr:hypothetical protein FB451DRAFT_1564038 [Mycena latifolia]